MLIAQIGTQYTDGKRAGRIDEVFVTVNYNGSSYSVWSNDTRVKLDGYAKTHAEAIVMAQDFMQKIQAHYGQDFGCILFDYATMTITIPDNYTPTEKQAEYAKILGAKIGVNDVDYTLYTIDQLKKAIDHIRNGGIVKFGVTLTTDVPDDDNTPDATTKSETRTSQHDRNGKLSSGTSPLITRNTRNGAKGTSYYKYNGKLDPRPRDIPTSEDIATFLSSFGISTKS